MRVRIRGTDLPGPRFDDGRASGCSYDDVMVGLQRGREVEQLARADAGTVMFELELRPHGERDARGPYAHGRPGERFIYLSWVAGPDHEMFRRAKIMLADVPAALWRSARTEGWALEATLSLTDARGGPRCGRLAPGDVSWAAVPDTDPSP